MHLSVPQVLCVAKPQPVAQQKAWQFYQRKLHETCFATEKARVRLTRSSPCLEQPSSYTQSATDQQSHFVFHLFIHLSQALVETSHCWQVLRVWLHPKLKQPLNACSKTAYFKTTFSLCRVKHCFKSTIFIFLFICSIPLEAWELHGRNVCTSVVFCAFLPSFFLGDGGVWGGGDLESLSQHAVPSQEDKSAHNLPTVTPS